MKVIVDDDACVGCGLCLHICPEVFEMEYERSRVIPGIIPSRIEPLCRDAVNECPASAITITDDEDKPQIEERPKRWRF